MFPLLTCAQVLSVLLASCSELLPQCSIDVRPAGDMLTFFMIYIKVPLIYFSCSFRFIVTFSLCFYKPCIATIHLHHCLLPPYILTSSQGARNLPVPTMSGSSKQLDYQSRAYVRPVPLSYPSSITSN